MNSVTVKVPATTANLACGFDTLGCALGLYNTLSFTLADTLSFSGCDKEYQTPDNLAYQGFAAVYSHLGLETPGVHIDIQADIPVCRGLGSSAAMLVGGCVAANELIGAKLTLAELLGIVTPIEGHPDNLAPALYGGLTASMSANGKAYSVPYAVHPSLHFLAISPDFPLSTHAARSVLPKAVPYGDALYNLSHLSVLPKAIELGDMELISLALTDKLHQPYRFPLIDEYDAVRDLAASFGAHAFCISGAGPTLLCLTDDDTLAPKLNEALRSLRHNWELRDLAIDTKGAVIL